MWFHLAADIGGMLILGTLLVHLLRASKAGAPFIPTFGTARMVRAAGIRPDDVVYELGCGDGRFSVAAVRAGASRAVGYDISGLWVAFARLRAVLSGAGDRCRFSVQDIRTCDPSEATLVYLFLMPDITRVLAEGPLLRLKPGARVLSSAFVIPETNTAFRLERTEKVPGGIARLYVRTG